MPIRAQAAGCRVSPHLALGRSRGELIDRARLRRHAPEGRAMRRMSGERYRVYAEDEFFAAPVRASGALGSPPAGTDAPHTHRAAGLAVLVGIVGAIAGVVAIVLLAPRAGTRRKDAQARVARAGVGAATAAASHGSQPQTAHAGGARSSSGRRGRMRSSSPAHLARAEPRPGASGAHAHTRTRARVRQVSVADAPAPLADEPADERIAREGEAEPAPIRPVDRRADRDVVARSEGVSPMRRRVEFGFER
jgi:hypothetical protein